MLHVVSTAERPELVTTSGTWRWKAFLADEASLEQVLQVEEDAARNGQLMPTVLLLLKDGQPVGMGTLCLDDLAGRPDLNPWLAGVYIDPPHRGKGFAPQIVRAVEDLARGAGIPQLFLYTSDARGLYQKAGWSHHEEFERNGKAYAIMQKQLLPG